MEFPVQTSLYTIDYGLYIMLSILEPSMTFFQLCNVVTMMVICNISNLSYTI